MNPESVKKMLAKRDVDVHGTWSEFSEKGEQEDVEAYLDFLKDKDLIDEEVYTSAHLVDDDIELAFDTSASLATLSGFVTEDGLDGEETLDQDPSQGSTLGESGGAPAAERYKVIGTVGHGAMGKVYLAKDMDLRRKVAFKRMLSHRTEQTRRFVTEVQITAQLDHPNIVPVYGLEITGDGRLAYAMKLVQGRTFAELIDEARASVAELGRPPHDNDLASRLEHFVKVLDAMAYAHSKGVVHRDLKPANIMVGRYHEIYVMDWGIAKLTNAPEAVVSGEYTAFDVDAAADASLRTRVGAIVGTPTYMAPEQAAGLNDQVEPRSDVFCLGLMLYELVLFRPALTGETASDVLERAIDGDLDPIEPAVIGEPLPPEVVAIIHKATSLYKRDRYPTVEAFADDVRRFLRGEAIEALPDTGLRRLARWIAHHQQATMLSFVAVVSVAMMALAAGYVRHLNVLQAEENQARARQRATTAFMAQVAAQGETIDNHFLWYEGLLEGLAAQAEYAFAHGTPQPAPAWDSQRYKDPKTAPPGMLFSKHYNRPISLEHPVYHVPPGVPEALWRPHLDLAQGMTPYLRSMFRVGPEGAIPFDGESVRMEWAYVALHDSGLIVMFPGAAGWEPSYDPRTRPWYRESWNKDGKNWGSPYVDLMGQGRLMSCVKVLKDATGTRIGVAGIDLELRFIINEYMKPEIAGFEKSYLLDRTGRIVLKSDAENDPFTIPPTEKIDDGIDYGRFDNAELDASVTSGSGTGNTVVGDKIVGWSRMQHLGWTFVVVADRAAALEARSLYTR